MRRVAELLGTKKVTANQYDQYGEYNHTTQHKRLGTWNNALAKSGLTISNELNISDDKLIEDLSRVAIILATDKLTRDQYNLHGEYSGGTLENRFGTWNKALVRAGLKISHKVDFSDVELFENILTLWQYYGHQPCKRELTSVPSRIFSTTPYRRRFGSWMNALKAFVDYANGSGAETTESSIEEVPENQINNSAENLIAESTESDIEANIVRRHITGRNPSLRLRWRVLQRDNFKCCGCGASPAVTLGVELHVDHIHPWSRWGETVPENLQTLCSKCNLGKSNLLL